MNAFVLQGDCQKIMAQMPDASVDAIVTDPPYELGFMGKSWDAAGIAYSVDLWSEALRVLKPGGHLLAFGGTRTYHRMACAIEDAGFEIRDSIHWIYGSGFPKSLDVSKALDKAAGAERLDREVVHGGSNKVFQPSSHVKNPGTPVTPEAQQWQGWGTALKPAHEPIVVARKPLVGTVAKNVLEHGTGGMNIDGCRVGTVSSTDESDTAKTEGRWPANIVLTHSSECRQVGQTEDIYGGGAKASSGFVDGYEGDGFQASATTVDIYECNEGCPISEMDQQSGISKDGVAVKRNLPEQGASQNLNIKAPTQPGPDITYSGSGGASRFFTQTDWHPIDDEPPFRYISKPSKKEKNAGLDGMPERKSDQRSDVAAGMWANMEAPKQNFHPTVKPISLMRWLVRLVTPPNGVVLDPFAGSGTTLVAGILEGVDVIGCEMTEDYIPIINGRVEWAKSQMTNG